jgi:serine/threonine protein phosphatase PrpC
MNVHSISLKGLRDQNEDKHDIIININGNSPQLNKINLFSVYDGHGGKQVSKYLKQHLSSFFTNKKVAYPLNKQTVYTIYDSIQQSLKNTPYAQYSGSTAIVVIMFKSGDATYLNILNVGDCRCVLSRDNIALSLTKDHKPHWPEENSRITQLGGKIVFDGFDFRIKDLSVSRAFGDLDACPYVTHRPDIYRYRIDKNDKFFVIACDGLWDVLHNHDVVNFILTTCYDISTAKRINKNVNIARKLAEYALKKGSTDNISIIIVFLD